jgi:hypothetical protein
MGRRPRPWAGADPDQAAALHHLVEAFSPEQVTVAAIQASQSAGQDRTPTITSVQARLLEEAS